MFEQFLSYLDHGGLVMVPLVTLAGLLWYALGARAFQLWTLPWRPSLRSIIAEGQDPDHTQHLLDAKVREFENDYNRGRVLIKTICIVAPLAGLLGTVSGMIETFDSLGNMSLYTQSGGIAGGISEALFTTQMGLVVAVPGVLLGRILDRRAERLIESIQKDALRMFERRFQGANV